MTERMRHAVMILPADQRDAGDRGSVAMGRANQGVSTYTIPLSADGVEPATHYACVPWVWQPFLDTIKAAKLGTLPAGVPWSSVDLTEADVLAMADALIVRDVEDGKHHGHFDAVCAELGLVPIASDEPI